MSQGRELVARRHPAPISVVAVLALLAALLAFGAERADAALTEPSASPSAEGADAAAAEDYWTAERLRDAEAVDPADLSPDVGVDALDRIERVPEPLSLVGGPGAIAAKTVGSDRAVSKRKTTQYPYRVHGKIFGTTPGEGDYSCSGTVIGSNNKNVVFTAGHCVFDRGIGDWSTNVVFIPGYRNGKTPYGVYPAIDLWALNGWQLLPEDIVAFSYDVAAIQLDGKVERAVGSRGIRFDVAPKRRYEIFGYPSRPGRAYNGERLIRCPKAQLAGREDEIVPGIPDPSVIAGPCFMQQGSSGGGWVIGKGYVNSVVSHGFCDSVPDLCGLTHGPAFDAGGARSLYKAVGGGKRKPTDSAACKKPTKRYAKAKRAQKKAKRALRKAKRRGNRLGPKKRRIKAAKRNKKAAKKQIKKHGC